MTGLRDTLISESTLVCSIPPSRLAFSLSLSLTHLLSLSLYPFPSPSLFRISSLSLSLASPRSCFHSRSSAPPRICIRITLSLALSRPPAFSPSDPLYLLAFSPSSSPPSLSHSLFVTVHPSLSIPYTRTVSLLTSYPSAYPPFSFSSFPCSPYVLLPLRNESFSSIPSSLILLSSRSVSFARFLRFLSILPSRPSHSRCSSSITLSPSRLDILLSPYLPPCPCSFPLSVDLPGTPPPSLIIRLSPSLWTSRHLLPLFPLSLTSLGRASTFAHPHHHRHH